MREIQTVCSRDCYDTCFTVASVDETGRLHTVKGDAENPVTQGITCPRCAKDADRVYRNRIHFPQKRSAPKPGRQFTRFQWNDALDRVSDKLRNTLDTWGPESVLVLKYAGNTGLLAGTFPLRLWNAIGATRTDNGVCSQSGHAGLRLHYGLSYGIQPESLHQHNLIVFWGYNPVVSAPHIWHMALKAGKQTNARIVVIDARKSETAQKADLWLQPKPGTDAAVANGIARYLIENDLIDHGFIKEWTDGFSEYKKAVMKWTPEAVEAISGIKWPTIEALASAYGEQRPSATMIGVGFQKTHGGADAVRAASLLPALLGQHRGFFYSNKMGYSIDMSYLSGQRQTETPFKVATQVSIAEDISRGAFKFIYVFGMNPAITLPNQNLLRQGFCRDDVYVVVHDTHWTETTDFADVVLPAQTYLEKEDVVIPWAHGFVRKSNRTVEPLEESRHEIDVMTAMAQRIGIGQQWIREDPWKALEKACENAFADGTFKDLLSGKTLHLKYPPLDSYQTTTGRIEFYSKAAEANGQNPVPDAFPVDVEKGHYLMLNSSVPSYTHSQFQECYGPIPSLIWINPQDAGNLGVDDNQTVSLYNDTGQTAARVKITDHVPTGVLWSPHEFVGLDGNFQNSITQSKTQRIGGGAIFNSTVVQIKPVAETS